MAKLTIEIERHSDGSFTAVFEDWYSTKGIGLSLFGAIDDAMEKNGDAIDELEHDLPVAE